MRDKVVCFPVSDNTQLSSKRTLRSGALKLYDQMTMLLLLLLLRRAGRLDVDFVAAEQRIWIYK